MAVLSFHTIQSKITATVVFQGDCWDMKEPLYGKRLWAVGGGKPDFFWRCRCVVKPSQSSHNHVSFTASRWVQLSVRVPQWRSFSGSDICSSHFSNQVSQSPRRRPPWSSELSVFWFLFSVSMLRQTCRVSRRKQGYFHLLSDVGDNNQHALLGCRSIWST